jgi:hypothetical protein
MRDSEIRPQGYSLEDTADFLEFDRTTVEYWLRMGHLAGEWDSRRSCWNVSPQSIIDFLRQSREPMPTGTAYRGERRRPLASAAVADMPVG